jgi:asparagine synthase (glutamine-hydrolysing)
MPAAPWDRQAFGSALSEPALADADAYLAFRRDRSPAFFFAPAEPRSWGTLFCDWDRGTRGPVSEANHIARGVFRCFHDGTFETGLPPDWHLNVLTGQRSPAHRHWSRIGDFASGDIKGVWELSRFGFAFPLARAFARTGDDRHADLFWQLVEDWQLHNPPQQGANWKCGQEISLRVMAWCFALYTFLGSPATTAARVVALAGMVEQFGHRIEANLAYALSQQNNHGVSEAMGLWTVGLLFPEFRAAARWRERGRVLLHRLATDLIGDDGGCSPNSLNYQRLMLHDFLWCCRLGELHQDPFAPEVRQRLERAASLLYQLQDPSSGRLPRYGHDDGSLILPLSNCDYQDYRPVIQAAQYFCTGTRAYPDGPWDEEALWLFGPKSLRAPVEPRPREDLHADRSGYYTIRARSGVAFTRACTFRHRPAHADLLHVDLYWKGLNVAIDPGTFSYNAPPPWDDAFAGTRYHNTVDVDGLDQMERANRFLWLPWARGRVYRSDRAAGDWLACLEAEHDGYARLTPPVRCRRALLRLGDEHWLVVDRLTSSRPRMYRLHWFLADLPYDCSEDHRTIRLQTGRGEYVVQVGVLDSRSAVASVVRADRESPRGWYSPRYSTREPALSMELIVERPTATLWTVCGPGPVRVGPCLDGLDISTPGFHVTMRSGHGDRAPLIASARLVSESPAVDVTL